MHMAFFLCNDYFFFQKIPWYKSEKLSIAAESFIINLVTAHNYYTYSILKQLFTFFITGNKLFMMSSTAVHFLSVCFSICDLRSLHCFLFSVIKCVDITHRLQIAIYFSGCHAKGKLRPIKKWKNVFSYLQSI